MDNLADQIRQVQGNSPISLATNKPTKKDRKNRIWKLTLQTLFMKLVCQPILRVTCT